MEWNADSFKHLDERDREFLKQYMNSRSSQMLEILSELRLYAPSDLPLVIEGESGTGKEVFVMALHALSFQYLGPLVAVNMGEGPETLFESALFGHRKGAFTGADQSKPGYFEQANGGTLFLDEINSLSRTLQPKLLRVLETRAYRPIGATRLEKTSARFVFSSNESLEGLMNEGRFRSDLFYRMGRVIRLPALRERMEDIPLLVESLLYRANDSVGVIHGRVNRSVNPKKSECIPSLGPGTLERLKSYTWPGNIRQLKQVLERALLVSSNGIILPEHLDLPYESVPLKTFGTAMEAFEESYFSQVFEIAGDSVRMGLRLTGMSETSYRRKFRKYGRKKI